MKFIDFIAKQLGYSKPKQNRSFEGASNSRLTSDWLSPATGANAELWTAIKPLRQRCREAERNDDYMRAYLRLSHNNVLGHCGIGLQMKITPPGSTVLDKPANDAIENAWKKWGKHENCTVNKTQTWVDVQELVLRSVLRDGAALVRKIRGFDNPNKYALQLLEIDHLDTDYNTGLPNGGTVNMGIEFDQWNAPVAYHIFQQHPGETVRNPAQRQYRLRIPASEMLHIFRPDRIGQATGAPTPSSSLKRSKMLNGYEEAELVAAREAACKGGGVKKATSEGWSGETDNRGNSLQDMEPGMTLELNPGEEYFAIDPNHPVEAYPAFTKSVLRGIASGRGISYNAMANDLEGVNYSSLREGKLQERDDWKVWQKLIEDKLCAPIFEDWLQWSLAMGTITLGTGSALPLRKFDYFNQPCWKARRWDWVDPMKDMQANILAIGARITSRRQVIEDMGGDIEEVDADFKNDPETTDIDTESVYAPNAQPEPAPETAGDEGSAAKKPASKGLGMGRLFMGLGVDA